MGEETAEAELIVNVDCSDAHWRTRVGEHGYLADLRMEAIRAADRDLAESVNPLPAAVEIRLRTLMMAFRRWTNVAADEQVMREALEEFFMV